MAYIGANPVNGFFEKQDLTTDGSTTTFTLQTTVGSSSSILVSVGGVIQEPEVAYNLGAGGTTIIFTEAPASTADTYVHYLGQAIVQNVTDLNGTEMVLDVDADTSFTADTDDEIDIKVAGSDISTIKATGFHNLDSIKYVAGTGDDLEIYHDGTNSLIANKTGALKIATETSGIAVTIGHTTSETTVADNLTVTGTLTVGGTVNFGDFDISNVGSIALDTITNDGTDITLDSSNDIVIDAAGGNIEFKDAGTLQLSLDMDGTDGAQVIQLRVDTDDLIFKQFDGTTVLTLDDDTTVKVATDLTVGDDLSLITDSAVLKFGADGDTTLTHTDGTGLTLNSTNKLCFNDASQFIQGASATVLDIAATDEIELTATLIDVVGTLAVSGTATLAGILSMSDGSAGAPSITNTGDTNTGLLFSAADKMQFTSGGTAQFTMENGGIIPVTDNDIDLGTASLEFKNVYVDGTVFTDALGFGTTVMTLPTADGNANQILITDGSGALSFTDNSGGTSWVAVKTSNYTASAGEGVFANTTSASFTVTLPASPSIGDEVSIKDYAGTFDTNNLTVGRNSQPIEGVAADLTVSIERAGLTLVYTDSTQGWLLKDK